ncbi:MAG: tricarballylate utilization 4Fe-4S protein TcuB [Oceanospirillales bacterium]|nr:tricarballylate utilization 4Fe-4S protein TcuB [Oceanospirillales bacterium]MBR9888711.1 tricarballylate utilization 4Fe-4S protein TcuB [Oceanospirillales bacterium]
MQSINVVNIDPNDHEQITDRSMNEARRQLEVCNACRYCESFCSVFPAVNRERTFSDATITQLANLCHNCRGCHYACQYTAPHEFGINIPKALAEVRQNSWQDNAIPAFMARTFHRSGAVLAVAVVIGFALLLWLINQLPQSLNAKIGEGFYTQLSHNAMITIFIPAFILPVLAIAVSVRRYWRNVGGTKLQLCHIKAALASVAKMRNLAGGSGEGCNFEDEDRFSNARRWYHQATMIGFLLCFAATSAGTLMHYLFDMQAPYALFSLPKMLGISGGVLLSIGTLGFGLLKLQADPDLADRRVWGGEMGFIILLFLVSTSGLALYVLAASSWLPELLAFHLGSVLAFFVLMPFSKMVHGFYRLAALLREQQLQQ